MGKFRKELKMIVSLLKTAGIPEPDGPPITGHRVLSWIAAWIHDGPHATAKRQITDGLGMDPGTPWDVITQRVGVNHHRLGLRTRALERALGLPVHTSWPSAIQAAHDDHAKAERVEEADQARRNLIHIVGLDKDVTWDGIIAAVQAAIRPGEVSDYADTQLRAIQNALAMAGVEAPPVDGTSSRTLRWVRNAIEQARERALEDVPKTFVVLPKDAPEQLGLELRYAAQKRYGNGVGVTDVPPLEWEHVHGVMDLVSSWRQTPEGDDRPPPPERVKIEAEEPIKFWPESNRITMTDSAVRSMKVVEAPTDFHTHGLEITPVGEMAVDVANALERSGIPAPDDGDLADWATEVVDTLAGYRQQAERALADGAR